LAILCSCTSRDGYEQYRDPDAIAELSVRSARPAPFETASDQFVPVPGSSLTFTPTSVDESWLILFCARLTGTGATTDDDSVDVRYLINGNEEGLGGVQSTTPGTWGTWQHFKLVTGTTEPQVVEVELRDQSGSSARIDDLRMFAFPLPPRAEPTYFEGDPVTEFASTTQLELLDASVAASRNELFIVLGLVGAGENPSGQDVTVWWETPGGETWHDDVHLPRGPMHSQLTARVVALTTGNHRYRLFAGAVGTRQSAVYPRFLALRAEPFRPRSAGPTQQESVTVAQPTELLSLDVEPTVDAVILYMQTGLTWTVCDGMPTPAMSVQYTIDGQPDGFVDYHNDNCSYRATYGLFGLLTEPVPVTLAVSVAATDPPRPARANELGIVAVELAR
jgi:hypothetical protein